MAPAHHLTQDVPSKEVHQADDMASVYMDREADPYQVKGPVLLPGIQEHVGGTQRP